MLFLGYWFEEEGMWYNFFRVVGMKPNIINNEERLPVLKIVRELKSTVIELPVKKEKKGNQEIPPHKYIMPIQPKGYRKVTGPDIL